MTEYIYRSFKISYNIVPMAPDQGLYRADGIAVYPIDCPDIPAKFHTEYTTYTGAEHEIKRMLERYVDFELRSFQEMKREKTQHIRI